MADAEVLCCIGGPWDGRTVATPPWHGDTLSVVVPPRLALSAAPPAPLPRVAYTRSRLPTPQGEVQVWLVEGLTLYDALQTLLCAYTLHQEAR